MKRTFILFLILSTLFLVVTLSACGGPAAGGVGGLFLLVVAALLFSLLGGTGCSDGEVHPCLSIEEPIDAGDTGDTDDDDVHVGPCLTPPLPDTGPPDTGDAGDSDTSDTGTTDTGDDDVDISPCLSPPPPDAGNGGEDAGNGGDEDAGARLGAPADSRDQILARMRDRLPEDVASRLEDKA